MIYSMLFDSKIRLFSIPEKIKLIIFIFVQTHNSNSDFKFDLVKSEKYKVEIIFFLFFCVQKVEVKNIYIFFCFRFFEIRKIKNSMSSTSPSQKIFWKYFLEKIEIRIPNSCMPAIFVGHLCFVLSQGFRTEKMSHLRFLTRDQYFEEKLKKRKRISGHLRCICHHLT